MVPRLGNMLPVFSLRLFPETKRGRIDGKRMKKLDLE